MTLKIRWYRPEDDPFLMELERLSPRGEPRPFVHWRRHFRDRANLYTQPYIFVAEKDNRLIGVTSIAIKDTIAGGQPIKLAYSFDTRVHPAYRRQRIGMAMQEEKLAFLSANGVHGLYALVVSTNYASVNMLEKLGFKKARLVLHLTFPPYPMIIPPPVMPLVTQGREHYARVHSTHGHRDLFVPEVAQMVKGLNFEHVCVEPEGPHFAALSVFDQSMVYQQVSADDAWPNEEQILRRARSLRIFDESGINHPAHLRSVFDYVRDAAVTNNVSSLTWIIDRADPVPGFVFEEASYQKDYWMMVCSLVSGWEPVWNGKPVYIDARDL